MRLLWGAGLGLVIGAACWSGAWAQSLPQQTAPSAPPAEAQPLPAPGAGPERGSPLTGAEFEAYSTGKTLTYAQGGVVWGTEQYLPGRKVRWAFTDDECKEGYWFEQADNQICFVYEADGILQCWQFYRAAGGGLLARFVNDPEGTLLSEVAQTDQPLACMGPKVGV